MNWSNSTILGYKFAYCPNSPYANKAGIVYQHVYIACARLGRKLKPNECVHHLDFNRSNNNPSNLIVMTKQAHAQLHRMLEGNSTKSWRVCPCCNKKFFAYKEQKYCSTECNHIQQQKLQITKEKLEELIWKLPTTKIAKIYGVSDTCISKWCKKWNISKPPRGYWIKLQANSY